MTLREEDLQTAVFRWAKGMEATWPELRWLHHIANGAKRDAVTAMRLKDQGVKPGILDLHLPVPRGAYHGLMIELKKPDGKVPKPSPEQAEYMAHLDANGYMTACINDFEQVKRMITDYLLL